MAVNDEHAPAFACVNRVRLLLVYSRTPILEVQRRAIGPAPVGVRALRPVNTDPRADVI